MAKRIEIYVGFKCNNNCIFCVEYFRRQKFNDLKVLQTNTEINEQLNKYREEGYSHLNILGGEPFLEPSFYKVLSKAKGLGFITAVTTNGSLLSDENIAVKNLPLIDDLILSIHGHNEEIISRQSQNKNLYVNLQAAFLNIKKYFRGRILKTNTVINNLNYKYLLDIVKFIQRAGISEISLTYMSIDDHNKEFLVSLGRLQPYLEKVMEYCSNNDLRIRFADIPLCFLGQYPHLDNSLYYDKRQKYDVDGKLIEHCRQKTKTEKCSGCMYEGICEGLDLSYYKIFGDSELMPIS